MKFWRGAGKNVCGIVGGEEVIKGEAARERFFRFSGVAAAA